MDNKYDNTTLLGEEPGTGSPVENSVTGPDHVDVSESSDLAIQKFTQEQSDQQKRRNSRFWFILLGTVAVLLSLRLVIVPVGVVGSSMDPTYKSGQLLVTVNAALVKSLDYGDVVVFQNENTNHSLYIKRLEGLPGDVIQIKDGKLYRNGHLVEEPFDNMLENGIYGEETTLRAGEYFVLGDNRNASTDSRFIGPVLSKDIRYVLQHKQ